MGTIEKIRFKVSVKTDGGFYPAGSVLFAPFSKDVMAEIEAGNTIEVLWDSSLDIGGVQVPADESSPSEEKTQEPKPVVTKEESEMEEKRRLEAYISMIDPGININRRKSAKTLRKDIRRMVMQKAKELGQVLDSSAGVDVLMEEFSNLKAAEKAIEEDI